MKLVIRAFLQRSFHSSTVFSIAKSEKSVLARLRSKTGYAISNCKKALVLHNEDYEKALAWLNDQAQKEGWDKAGKLLGRQTVQGLVGLLSSENTATLIELNCETDFVARNKEFKNLVATAARACYSYNMKQFPQSFVNFTKINENRDHLLSTTLEDQIGSTKTLSDLIALKIGLLGENMSLCRALSIKVAEGINIGCYTHPIPSDSVDKTDNFLYGKYGAIVLFKKSGESLTNLTQQQCGRQLAQHVIGMKPQIIGSPYVPTADQTEDPMIPLPEQITVSENEDLTHASPAKDDEVRMLYQEFLSDSAITVGDFAFQNGIEIMDFVRFECGETAA